VELVVSRTKVATEYLDKATLVRTGADVADAEGWSALTLSRVAREVDRHVSSLYAHVDGLDDLRREITLLALSELSDEVWRAALGRTQGEALRAIATVERDYGRRHPGRMTAIWSYSDPGDMEFTARGTRLAEPLRATFRSFGLDEGQVHHAHSVFSSAVRGLVVSETTNTFRFGDSDVALSTLVDLFLVAFSTGAWPAPDQ
jgi:AcrR family transcriptional regulator